MFQNTTTGPHKDNIEMFWGEKDMRKEASQGEKKLFLIALKKTEAVYFYKKTNKKPVVLLDDLFAKLDNKKCVDVISLFNNNFQTIITSTDNTVEPIIKKLNLKPGQKVLDIGSGWGTLAINIAHKMQNIKGIGVK